METEFYYDGDHNGGMYNSGNLNTYGYCYQNPILFVDPNGKQNVAGALIGARIGALIGGGLEYGKQVYNNYEKGLTFKESLTTNINTRSIVASATEGAIMELLLDLIREDLYYLSTTTVAMSQSAGSVAGGLAKRKINNEEVFDTEKMITDGIAGLVSGGVSNQLEKKVASRVVAENIGNKLVREVVKKAEEKIIQPTTTKKKKHKINGRF